jgi:hypothetical protein
VHVHVVPRARRDGLRGTSLAFAYACGHLFWPHAGWVTIAVAPEFAFTVLTYGTSQLQGPPLHTASAVAPSGR